MWKMKKCSKCEKLLPANTDYFHKSKNGTLGLHSQCKECRLKQRKRYYNEKENKGLHYKENKLEYIINMANQRAKKIGAGQITRADIEDVFYRHTDEEMILYCPYCNRKIHHHNMVHLEHIIPLSKGGRNKRNNILLVCKYCNRSKADEDLLEWYREQLFYKKEREMELAGYLEVAKEGVSYGKF